MREKLLRVCFMEIDGALILSAGLGTRMGVIGKSLPKVLWPIFFKECLLLQIAYCRELGIKRIYVNTHFLADKIVEFVDRKKLSTEIKVLYENPLLDSGGAIHNLARQKDILYRGNFLLVNGDQFLFFEKKYWGDVLKSIPEVRAVLFGIKVAKNEPYNEIVCQNGFLKQIKKPDKRSDFITYSGLGVVRLDGLKPVSGGSKFFETVADFSREKISVLVPNEFEYWDFGTESIYFENIKRLCESPECHKSEMMRSFLRRNKAINDNVKKFFSTQENAIDLLGEGRFVKNSISFGDMVSVQYS